MWQVCAHPSICRNGDDVRRRALVTSLLVAALGACSSDSPSPPSGTSSDGAPAWQRKPYAMDWYFEEPRNSPETDRLVGGYRMYGEELERPSYEVVIYRDAISVPLLDAWWRYRVVETSQDSVEVYACEARVPRHPTATAPEPELGTCRTMLLRSGTFNGWRALETDAFDARVAGVKFLAESGPAHLPPGVKARFRTNTPEFERWPNILPPLDSARAP